MRRGDDIDKWEKGESDNDERIKKKIIFLFFFKERIGRQRMREPKRLTRKIGEIDRERGENKIKILFLF